VSEAEVAVATFNIGRGPGRRGPRSAVPFRLKVALIGIEPEIWRRVIVPSSIKLSRLHHVLQEVMGWTNSHLHRFSFGSTEYSDVDFELDVEHEDESQVKLVDLVPQPPSALMYEYDFGDSWDHVVIIEDYWIGREIEMPVCLGGARACPPEDVGGKPGYEEFLRALRDPTDEEHEDMLRWVGGGFDPEAFNVDEASARLRKLGPRSRVRKK
jgi:hypothetical protein